MMDWGSKFKSNGANSSSGQSMQLINAGFNLVRQGYNLYNLLYPAPEAQVVKPPSQDATPGSSKGKQAGATEQVIGTQTKLTSTDQVLYAGQTVFTLLDPSKGLAIVGSIELGYDLTSALLWDHPTFIQACKTLKFDWQKAWGSQTLTVKTVVAFLLECKAAKGYQPEMIADLIKQRGYKGKKMVEMFFEDLLKKLKDLSHPDVKKKEQRSNKGEHVINNGVLSLHKDIINLFLQETLGLQNDNLKDFLERVVKTDDHLSKDYYRPVDEPMSSHIRNDLVAHVPIEVPYFDTNCVLYGISIDTLRQLAVKHMTALYYSPDSSVQNQGSEWSLPLMKIIATIIEEPPVFVDPVAFKYWKMNHSRDMQKYLNAKQAVVNMFETLYDNLRDWVLRIKRAQRRP